MTSYWVDIVILVIIGLSVITGLIRGFLKELIALCVWFIAIWLAYHYYSFLDPLLQPYIQDKTARTVAGFVIILVATLLVGGLFNGILGFVLKKTGLSGTDRILGMGFGFVRGVFIVALIMVVVKLTSLPEEEYASNSRLYAKFEPVVAWIYAKVPTFIRQAQALDKDHSLADFPTDLELT